MCTQTDTLILTCEFLNDLLLGPELLFTGIPVGVKEKSNRLTPMLGAERQEFIIKIDYHVKSLSVH